MPVILKLLIIKNLQMKFTEFITQGTLFTYQVYTYVTKTGARFKFSYHLTSGGYYEIDIHEQPSYGSRDSSLSATHRLSSPRNTQYKICLTSGREPKTLQLAKKISCEWGDLTEIFIKKNITLDRQVAMRN